MSLLALALVWSMVEAAEPGKVTLPMTSWEQMLSELEEAAKPERSSVVVLPIERRIEGGLAKGLFSGTLTARFQVLEADGHVRVPLLDAGASLDAVRLDGSPTSLLSEGGMYTVGIDKPGVHTVQVKFFWGKEQDRFARRMQFRLPEAGPTAVSLLVPEVDIEAKLTRGVLTAETKRKDGTLLAGNLDASGLIDLSWHRKLTHRATEKVRLEARQYTLFNVQEAMSEGRAVFDITVLEGETDRIDLNLPADIEVLGVDGDAVLQWHTESGKTNRLVVLLRYLVEERTRVSVRFQFPADPAKPVELRMPLTPPGVSSTGLIGIQSPAGLSVQVSEAKDAEALQPHELPPELTSLTPNPILYGFSFEKTPALSVSVTRQKTVELTTTLIDELQASSVLNQDGWEVTKLKLRMRNNVRQYLSVRLPEGAVLTHSLIDGQPVRPAAGADGGMLFPLRQSERIGKGGETRHTVSSGETLSGLANFYYSDPNAWHELQTFNQLGDEFELQVGQELRIPARASVQESSFVIEMAYKRRHSALGGIGYAAVELPALDVDTVEVTWHVYLPESLTPFAFHSALTQYSAIRYDPFRRVRDFLEQALFERSAWASMGKYQSILKQRRYIYKAEAEQRGEGEMVLASFPLVGDRYRFKTILLGKERPRVAFTYAVNGLATFLRWLALIGACAGTLLLMHRRRDRRTWLIAGGALAGTLVVAYFVLGVHRRVVWGVDLALLITLARWRAAALWQPIAEKLRSPWTLFDAITFRNFALAVGLLVLLWFVLWFPLLLSSITLILALFAYRRSRPEVSHA